VSGRADVVPVRAVIPKRPMVRGPPIRSVSPDGAGPVSRGTAAASLVMADRTVVPSNGNHLEARSHGY
jgi:hypothetical protein